jgi:hypothetical protein
MLFRLPMIPALLVLPCVAAAELRIPGGTAYSHPDPEAIEMSEREQVVRSWSDSGQQAVWFGQFSSGGELKIQLAVKLKAGATSELRLEVAGQSRERKFTGTGDVQRLDFGTFAVPGPGYGRIALAPAGPQGSETGDIVELVLDGAAAGGAHFNRKPRRNAASVHLAYQVPKDLEVAGFYNEVTAVDDPVTTFYMACGFARGYFGMQVNSATERRIIFSVWDAAEGAGADSRKDVRPENHVQLLAKGEGVEASAFGGEGTGGHSHLVYPWKTGEAQKFWLTCRPEGGHTDYTGWWYHPGQQRWFRLATFRAPKDGKWLRGLHSFSENFWGTTGHLRRKALFGPQWIRSASGAWSELTSATFSHDATGREDRRDRFMGVERGRFFLSHGGFADGFTRFGEPFERAASGQSPPAGLPQ